MGMKRSINSPPREQKKKQRASCRFIAGFSKSASSRERNDRLFRAKTDLLSLASFTWLNGRFPSANLNTKRESALGGVHTGGDAIEGREIGFVCKIPRLGEGHFGMGWFRHLAREWHLRGRDGNGIRFDNRKCNEIRGQIGRIFFHNPKKLVFKFPYLFGDSVLVKFIFYRWRGWCLFFLPLTLHSVSDIGIWPGQRFCKLLAS